MPCDEETFEKILAEVPDLDPETGAKLRGAFNKHVTPGKKTPARGHGAPAPNTARVASF